MIPESQSSYMVQSVQSHGEYHTTQKQKAISEHTSGWNAELYRYTLSKYISYSLFFVSSLCVNYLTPGNQTQGSTQRTPTTQMIPHLITPKKEVTPSQTGPDRIAIISMSPVPKKLGPRGTELSTPDRLDSITRVLIRLRDSESSE